MGGLSTTGGALDGVIKSSVGCWKELDEPLRTESLDPCLVIFTGVLGSDPTVGKIVFQFKILSNFQQFVVFMRCVIYEMKMASAFCQICFGTPSCHIDLLTQKDSAFCHICFGTSECHTDLFAQKFSEFCCICCSAVQLAASVLLWTQFCNSKFHEDRILHD